MGIWDKAKRADVWTCTGCFSENGNDLDKCAACDTARPSGKGKVSAGKVSEVKQDSGVSAAAPASKFTFGGKAKAAAPPTKAGSGGFKFGGAKATPATSAEAKAEAAGDDAAASAEPKATVKKGSIWDKAKKSDTWNCKTCMSENENSLDKCGACGEARPGSKASATSADAKAAPASGFKFGGKAKTKPSGASTTDKPKFKFGGTAPSKSLTPATKSDSSEGATDPKPRRSKRQAPADSDGQDDGAGETAPKRAPKA
eukprot:m.111771 g.111771  ORF g.111771 m.111771 type:complete len:257 (-) comp13460_c0_seq1:366-1136(-)